MSILEIAHSDLIKENEVIMIPSIFAFKGGAGELFSFLHGCKLKNCTVYFENEDITVKPDDDVDGNYKLSLYAEIPRTRLVDDYLRYLNNFSEMQLTTNQY